jgi:hypothetical protein
MKKSILATIVTALISLNAMALEVNVNRYAGYAGSEPGFDEGGEFTVTSVNPDPAFNAILNNYAPSATFNGGFESFCLNTQIELQNNPLNGTIIPGSITAGAAWLYSQFARGQLNLYTYAPGAGRQTSALDLQMAIWELQGFSAGVDTVAATTFYNMAVSQFGSVAAATALDNGQSGVEELYLTHTTANGGSIVSQPLLVLVPDGGSALILLGVGLSGLALMGRRMCKA